MEYLYRTGLRTQQNTDSRITEIRLKLLEGNVAVLQQEVDGIKTVKQIKR